MDKFPRLHHDVKAVLREGYLMKNYGCEIDVKTWRFPLSYAIYEGNIDKVVSQLLKFPFQIEYYYDYFAVLEIEDMKRVGNALENPDDKNSH